MATPSNPLGAIVGTGGDIFLNDTSTLSSSIILSHLYITSDAVISHIAIGDIKANGTSVTLENVTDVQAARKYTGTIPQGYLICAGEGKGIEHTVCLTSGSAEGIVFKL